MTLQVSMRQEIYQVVAQIPVGFVATYGQIARLAGFPRHARQVGYALNHLDEQSDLPWHRVVNAQGRISIRGAEGESEHCQRKKLEQEGILFEGDKISLKRFQWQP